MRLAKLSLILSCLCLCAPAAQTARAQTAASAAAANFAVDSNKSSLAFHIVHKLHRVDGESTKLEGRARLLPDGKAQISVRVAADSFDSKNVNRDAKVKEVVEATRYPQIELKAAGDGITLPTSLPGTLEKTFHAQLSFHGVQKTLELPVKLSFAADGSVRAQAKLSLSLDEFKIERPSLLFVKIDDTLQVDVDVVLEKGPGR